MAKEPEARIAPPEGNGEPLENMSGGRGRVHGAGSVGNSLIFERAIARSRERVPQASAFRAPASAI